MAAGLTALQIAEQREQQHSQAAADDEEEEGKDSVGELDILAKHARSGTRGLSSAEYLQFHGRRLDAATAFVGSRVVRGQHWTEAGGGTEDAEGEGTIVGCTSAEGGRGPSGDAPRFAEMARVRWDGGAQVLRLLATG